MTIESNDGRRRARSGFTLPEATMALVILGIAAAGVLLPFAGGAAVQAEGVHRTLGTELANDLMERIIATSYGQIVADWNGYAEAQGQVKDANGVVFTDPIYAKYSRNVACDYVYVQQQSGPPLTPNFLFVTVKVERQGRQIAALSSLVSQ